MRCDVQSGGNAVVNHDASVVGAVGAGIHRDPRGPIDLRVGVGLDLGPVEVAVAGGGDDDAIVAGRHVGDEVVLLAVPRHRIEALARAGESAGDDNGANRVGTREDLDFETQGGGFVENVADIGAADRKSTRLNSSHLGI